MTPLYHLVIVPPEEVRSSKPRALKVYFSELMAHSETRPACLLCGGSARRIGMLAAMVAADDITSGSLICRGCVHGYHFRIREVVLAKYHEQ